MRNQRTLRFHSSIWTQVTFIATKTIINNEKTTNSKKPSADSFSSLQLHFTRAECLGLAGKKWEAARESPHFIDESRSIGVEILFCRAMPFHIFRICIIKNSVIRNHGRIVGKVFLCASAKSFISVDKCRWAEHQCNSDCTTKYLRFTYWLFLRAEVCLSNRRWNN